ncbi:MAG: hypothetical protein J6A63_06390 [Clostridia bacterium]|nr:hypothetical protein [Clostridia bacterium]
MNKKHIKLTALLVCAAMAGSMLAACGGGNESSSDLGGLTPDSSITDEQREKHTVLSLGIFNGGVGYEWTKKVAAEFEKEFAEVSFEEGKTGVVVDINPQKDAFSVDGMRSAIKQGIDAEDIYYSCYNVSKDFARDGTSLNITDWVTEDAYKADRTFADWELVNGKVVYTNATSSIQDKMYDVHKEGHYLDESDLTVGAEVLPSGYYSLPFEDSLTGFVYDHDLFEEEGWLIYDGPNGLPKTEEDFFDLLDTIYDANMIPFTYAANDAYDYFSRGLTQAFLAQYEGYENAELDYTYDGEYVFDADTAAIINENEEGALSALVDDGLAEFKPTDGSYKVTITPETAWVLIYQPGKAKYVEFMRRVISTKYIDPATIEGTYTFRDAQKNFVWSWEGLGNQKRIAMLYEGEWWENEARTFFAAAEYGQRDFRFMPLPTFEGQKNHDEQSIGNYSKGVDLFVSSKTKIPEVCRLWLQFAHSEESLETFTMQTGLTRFFDYDLSDAQYNQLTKFAQNVYDIKKTDKTGIVIHTARHLTQNHEFYDAMKMGGFGSDLYSTIDGKEHKKMLVRTFFENPGTTKVNITSEQYINGMYKYYTKAKWDLAYATWQENNADA